MEKKHKLLTFYLKCLVISLPVLLLVAFYAYKDPFMVLRSYTDYDHSWVVQDEGAVAWEKYKQQRHDGEQFREWVLRATDEDLS